MTESNRPDDLEIASDETQFQASASELLLGLFVLAKVALVHKMDNQAVEPAVRRFFDSLRKFHATVSPEAAIQFVGDAVYVNRRLVRADLSTWERAKFLKSFLARLQVSEVTFDETAREESIRQFVQAVREVALDPSQVDNVRQKAFLGISFRTLEAVGVAHIDELLRLPDPVQVVRAYASIVVTLRELLESLQRGKRVSLIPVRRAIQGFVRLPDRTKSLQLGVFALEQFRYELAGRLANISLLVLMMGRQLGLADGALREMAVAASLACVGRAVTETIVFADPESCATYDAFTEGTRWLLPVSGNGRAAALRIIAALEQSSAASRRGGHPLSRMIAAADSYDRWTARAPRGAGMAPAAALSRLVDAADIDPTVGKLLIATLGLFPVGTTVKLTTGDLAIVVDVTGDTRRLHEPLVMVVSDARGNSRQEMIDLAGSGIRIAGTVDARELDLNVGGFLFA